MQMYQKLLYKFNNSEQILINERKLIQLIQNMFSIFNQFIKTSTF